MSIEAMKWAIEVFLDRYSTADQVAEVIGALRQAIEQAEKREWVGLTDEEVQQVYIDTEQMVFDSSAGNESVTLDFPICIYRAIEAKLKEKNT